VEIFLITNNQPPIGGKEDEVEKKITAFVRSRGKDAETNLLTVQVVLPDRGDKVTGEFDFLAVLGFKFNQVEPDYLDAEFETPDYGQALQVITALRGAGYTFDD